MYTLHETIPFKLASALDRLLSEHDIIRESVLKLERLAMELKWHHFLPVFDRIQDIKHFSDSLLSGLGIHEKWESDVLIPMINEVAPRNENPHLMTSLWMLTQEKHGEIYFQLSWERLNAYLDCPNPDLLNQGIEHLLHGCRLIKEHLESEEAILVPISVAD